MIVSALFLAAARGSIVVATAAVAARALRSKPAALRHSIWSLAVASHLALPIAALFMPQRDIDFGAGSFMNRVSAVVATTVNKPIPTVAPRLPVQGTPVPSGSTATTRASSLTTLQLLTLIWAVGAMLMGARFLIGTVLVARDTRRASRTVSREWLLLAGQIQEELHLHRSVTLLRRTERGVPYTWGILSPVVGLPSDADTWTSERLRIVLIHELAHVKRYDAMTELIAQLTLVIFWFDPLVWLAIRRMRTEREHACDDRVLVQGVKPSLYVEELLTMMKAIGKGVGAPGFGAIAMARRSQFESRMFAVLDERKVRSGIERRTMTIVAVAMTTLLLCVASVRLAAAKIVDLRASAIKGVAAFRWGQSDFDEMVDDCKRARPKLRVQYCEVRTIDLVAITGRINFRGGYIDGVIFTSKGAPRVTTARALVRAEAITMADARALASKVTTSVADGVLHSDGPGDGRSNYWSVLYEVTLPAGRSVKARTELGQIGLRDFEGDADIAAVNGPLQVFGSAGDIRGHTESGPIFVGLGGTRWEGAGLDLQSQNGPIYLSIPPRYSGHLITGTTNGPMQLAYPLLVRSMNSKRIEADIGSGGPPIRVTTLNGPADIR